MLTNEDIKRIMDITISISRAKDTTKLLETILDESMKVAHADAGTLYIYKEHKLHFMLMRNKTMGTFLGGNGEKIDLPPVEMNLENVSAYCAIKKEIIHIDDVYNNDKFNFEGPKKYDLITGYHTKSQLVIPLLNNEGELIGVMQLINAIKDGVITSFDSETTDVIASLASESAIVLSNMMLYENIKHLLKSFVKATTTAIDSRTPYNAHHTKNVSKYCLDFSRYLQRKGLMKITDHDIDEIVLAANLHDIGKMAIPLEVLNKETRLGDRVEVIELRYHLISEFIENDFLAKRITNEEYLDETKKLDLYYEGILKINKASYLNDELSNLATKIIDYEYNHLGKNYKLIIDEADKLKIIKGTLSTNERNIVQSHVEYTEKILSEIEFGQFYNDVPYLACSHHEYLDGSGYPKKLKADEITPFARMITIIDIYESLTSSDRPYKKAYDKPQALKILYAMVDEGKLDKDIVSYFDMFLKERIS